MFGLITGSGFYDVPDLENRATEQVSTAYGDVVVTTGRLNGHELSFLPRHGSDHSIPPQAINYRANIAGLREMGVEAILASAVVGSIVPEWTEGTMAVITDYIDFTSGRADTFFDGSEAALAMGSSPVVHTDMTEPYDAGLCQALLAAADDLDVNLHPSAVYCCTNGPRFETPAEIAMMGKMGGHVVGMTGYPEVALAVEAGIPYAALAMVSNPAAGVGDQPVSVEAIIEALEIQADKVYRLVGETINRYQANR